MSQKPPYFFRKPATTVAAPPSLKARHRWLRNPRFAITCTAAVAILAGAVHAGDILRGGATTSSGRRNADARANAGSDAAAAAQTRAQDRLARTTKAVNDMRNLQSAARAAAGNTAGIPDGLVIDGLDPVKAGEIDFRWDGANAPVQNGNEVIITQNLQQAVLHWRTLNVGKNTQLTFDQSAGGADVGRWIAFNKVFDPTARPSQIRGQIKADGQVYIINQNGIIFGAGSQVNARTIVASTLPINDNLVEQGLLNNRDAQFLFTGFEQPGGTDGTPVFTPPPRPASGRYGNILVEPGALLRTNGGGDGNGGRVMLVGANVINQGVLEAPAGQAILAAGLEVGIRAHSQNDPSLRGLDVWVGRVAQGGLDYAGTIENTGLVETQTGSIFAVGRTILQSGAFESSTTVNLNGRIDILASYGAVANPNFDNDGALGFGAPVFLNQSAGLVEFGASSFTRVLPDLASTRTIPGTELPERSRVEIQAGNVRFLGSSVLMASSGVVNIRAGSWPFRATFVSPTSPGLPDPDGYSILPASLPSLVSGSAQRFLFDNGEISISPGALLAASGSTQGFVPLAQHVLEVQLRGGELADSPLQRGSALRGARLVVDLRNSGTLNGRPWVGTPLADLLGFTNLIERDVAQLTARGGEISLSAGTAVRIEAGATVDVSGGLVTNEGGQVRTTRLIRNGRDLVNIKDADPNVVYDGIYTGTSEQTSSKWGVSRTFSHALAPLGSFSSSSYVTGSDGGTLSITAPATQLDGTLLGQVVTGPRQTESAPQGAGLRIRFQAERQLDISSTVVNFLAFAPKPVAFEIADNDLAEFSEIRAVINKSVFASDGGGFAHLEVENVEGNVLIASGRDLVLAPGGSLIGRAQNVTVDADIIAPGGTVALTALNYSPFLLAEQQILNTFGLSRAPNPIPESGIVLVSPEKAISVAGEVRDERPTSSTSESVANKPFSTVGGTVSLTGYEVLLGRDSLIDASGGLRATTRGTILPGTGGSIEILGGQDPVLSTSIGGKVQLGGELRAFGIRRGGSLTLQANQVEIGDSPALANRFHLTPEFFTQGGFRSYTVIGIGGRDANGQVVPGLRLAEGATVAPVAQTVQVSRFTGRGGTLELQPTIRDEGQRPATSLTLRATGADDGFTTAEIEALGILELGAGSLIVTDPGASVTIQGQLVSVRGGIRAPGGTITVAGSSRYPSPADLAQRVSTGLPTVLIASGALLDASGTAVSLPDPFDRRAGILYDGGAIRVSGNILALEGSRMDVSGASATFDFHPSRVSIAAAQAVPVTAGLTTKPWGQRATAVNVVSDGGIIALTGSELLVSDAALRGAPGGLGAIGGTLQIDSGRFYRSGDPRTSADINLVVTASRPAAEFFGLNALPRPGQTVDALLRGTAELEPIFAFFDSTAAASLPQSMGYFSAERFAAGEFAALDLGQRFFADAQPIAYGGNVEFRGPVSINAASSIRLAGGGIIRADNDVTLSAPYIALGQEFRPPRNPADTFRPFTQSNPAFQGADYFAPPTAGPGSLQFNGRLIDVGTVSLQGIQSTVISAEDGDIRGNGVLALAGDLILRAGQVFPTLGADFSVFAYPTARQESSITILGSGSRPLPFSAGGSVQLYASQIVQAGTLRAPFGSITLGWDGRDLNPDTAALDQPVDPVGGFAVNPVGDGFVAVAAPIAATVTLASGSITSVSAVDPATGQGLTIPYGISPEGLTWIDPRGVNVTVGGLPTQAVTLSGTSLVTAPGSVIDLRGGGDLLGFRFVAGNGGSIDLLGSASATWGQGETYESGDLVLQQDPADGILKTWAARVSIDPTEVRGSTAPGRSSFWTLVPESYAVLPSFPFDFSPYSPFNNGQNANLLGGEPGFVSGTLRLGDQLILSGGNGGLPSGTYTLLARRYALLPGAYLVTPSTPPGSSTVEVSSTLTPRLAGANLPDGSARASGVVRNSFSADTSSSGARSSFEIATSDVLAERAEYTRYSADAFITEAADRLGLASVQRLPRDSGTLTFRAVSGLSLSGDVQSPSVSGGRGSIVDLATEAPIFLIGGAASAPAGSVAALRTEVLQSWNADSFLIGALRRQTPSGFVLDVLTDSVTLDNAGSTFAGSSITLAAKRAIDVRPAAAISASGVSTGPAANFRVAGDGVLLRVSSDADASTLRTGVTGAPGAILRLGAGASVSGPSVTLDSSYSADFSPEALIQADTLRLAAGQIAIVLEPQSGPLPNPLIGPQMVIDGRLREQAESSRRLTLQSYRSIDIFGDGTFGSRIERLELQSGGLRGFAQGTAGTVLAAGEIVLSNSSGSVGLAASGAPTGSLVMSANVIRFGANTFAISNYADVMLSGAGGVVATADGLLTTDGRLTLVTPILTADRGVSSSLESAGDLLLLPATTTASVIGGLGASLRLTGSSVIANSLLFLPSGAATLLARTGDVTVGGNIDVSGTRQDFYDLTRLSDAGRVSLEAATGNVRLLEGSRISVEGASGGGNAGQFTVSAPGGVFDPSGVILGFSGGVGAADGTFVLDTGSLVSFSTLASTLDAGGFFASRTFRIRTGNVLVDGTTRSRFFSLTADGAGGSTDGNILITGLIDGSGETGGSITMTARGNLTLASTSSLTVAARNFDAAGKGGEISLESGAGILGVQNTGALLDLQSGSAIDLSVASYLPGSFTTAGSSAFFGRFQGVLHLRAPRTVDDVRISSLGSSIVGGSAVIAEAARIYNQPSGILNSALRTTFNNDANAFMNANAASIESRLLAGNPSAPALASILLVAPGVEIINSGGNLALGTVNALQTEDWNLAPFRYGPKRAPGFLTLRASGDVIFNNSLSDGFNAVTANAASGWSALWLAPLSSIDLDVSGQPLRPLNAQSWSYRITAGADLRGAGYDALLGTAQLQPGLGSVLVGEFYAAIPNNASNAIGFTGLTANTIGIGTNRTRYEVIRTGTGSIQVAAARDIQLRNVFASIYTGGVAIPRSTQVFQPGDFVSPIVNLTAIRHPGQGDLGAIQQGYTPQWSLAGGSITLAANEAIRRTTLVNGVTLTDASRQIPTNWLYRRGYVTGGTVATNGGVDGSASFNTVTDAAPSPTWWVDFSNFFQGIGALGGGNIRVTAGTDIINVDASIPTNARMAGLDPVTGLNLSADSSRLVEYGGGDLQVSAARDLSGGIYYVERGNGDLFAGRNITTNSARSPSLNFLGSTSEAPEVIQSSDPAVFDPATWLPTTLLAGRSSFGVRARGDVLLGPVANAFLLPQGLNNKFWYKTYFQTYSETASVTVASLGGSVTHRLAATPPGGGVEPILALFLRTQNLYSGVASSGSASNFQPWIRLAETDVSGFSTAFTVAPPTLRTTAFAGDIGIVGDLNLFPAPQGTIELVASKSIQGLQISGRALNAQRVPVTVWTSGFVNLSDAAPSSFPGVTSPIAYQSLSTVGRNLLASRSSRENALAGFNLAFAETGSFTGEAATIERKRALHDPSILHRDDPNPARFYSGTDDISGLTIYTAKPTQILAGRDLTDVALYIQNVSPTSLSIVSAGRDVIPNNENAPTRSLANNLALGNVFEGSVFGTIGGTATNALPGDIQVSGPGFLQVFAGRNIDLGTAANLTDGRGVGITTIGNNRNPFLPFEGAGLVVMAGVTGASDSGPALGLAGSSLRLDSFLEGVTAAGTLQLRLVDALDAFFEELKASGQAGAEDETAFDLGYAAIEEVFGSGSNRGQVFTRSRDIRTISGGDIRIAVPGGGITMASDIFGNPLTPPGIVTEFGGSISTFTDGSVNIGRARIFTLRGGDITMWSSTGDIAAGTSPRSVVTAPPTRVLIDSTSANVQTDLGGIATGGGIGTLKLSPDDEESDVTLVAPRGAVDAGDAGIRATGNITIAAVTILNADNISAGGSTSGVPTAPTVAAPNISGLTSGNTATSAASAAADQVARQAVNRGPEEDLLPSIISVEVLGYGG